MFSKHTPKVILDFPFDLFVSLFRLLANYAKFYMSVFAVNIIYAK